MKKHSMLALALAMMSPLAMAQVKATSAPARLLTSPVGLMAPVYSPDGSMIAATGDNHRGIFVASAQGKDLRIVSSNAAAYGMQWTADSRSIVAKEAFDIASGKSTAVRRAASRSALFNDMKENAAKITSSNKALAQFAGRTLINPALSPDGSKIAFQIVGKGMWLINADGTGLTSLGKGSHPAWMPDNRNIVFTVVEDNGNTFTASTLKWINIADKSSGTIMEKGSIIPMTPAVAPNGKTIAFENAADASIYTLNVK